MAELLSSADIMARAKAAPVAKPAPAPVAKAAPVAKPAPAPVAKAKVKPPGGLLSSADIMARAKAAKPTKAKPPVSAEAKPKAEEHRAAKNIGALADMVAGGPGFIIGTLAETATRAALGATSGITGLPHRGVARIGAEVNKAVTEKLSPHPGAWVLEKMGYKNPDKNDVANVMGQLDTALSKGGKWVEKHTGGRLTEDDVKFAANAVQAFAPAALAKGAKGAKAAPVALPPAAAVAAASKPRGKLLNSAEVMQGAKPRIKLSSAPQPPKPAPSMAPAPTPKAPPPPALVKAPKPSGLVDKALGSVSTRMGNISQSGKLGLRQFEQRKMLNTYTRVEAVTPFVKALDATPKAIKPALDAAIFSGDAQRVKALMTPEAHLEYMKTRALLVHLGDQLKDSGRLVSPLKDYFPRVVKDREGLLNSLGHEMRSEAEKALATAALRTGQSLTAIEEAAVLDKFLKQPDLRGKAKPGFSKARSFDSVTEAMLPYYYSPAESLGRYVNAATHDLEVSAFFGKTALLRDGVLDLEGSIGTKAQRALESGEVHPAQLGEYADLLRSRFGPGERSPAKALQHFQNITTTLLLANPASAVVQLGDLAAAVYLGGLRPALGSAIRYATGRGDVTLKDFGMVSHIAAEFGTGTSTAKFMTHALKATMFTAMDHLSKGVVLNTMFAKYKKLAMTNKGQEQIIKKYGAAFGGDLPALVNDLKAGKLTDNTRTLLFSELSDIQPVSKSEMPQSYLDHPNGRFMYSMKSFMLKQMDILRRDAYRQIKIGNYRAGVTNLARYATLMGLAGATFDAAKEFILGHDVDFDAVDIPMNFIKMFGVSEYFLDHGKKTPASSAAALLAPASPAMAFDKILTADPKAVKYLPVFGRLLYEHGMGGKEAFNEKRAEGK